MTQIISAAFGSAGERCMACSVVVAVGNIGDKLVDKLVQAAGELTIGNGLDEGVFLGPVIRAPHKDRTISYIETGEKEGALLIRDGRKDATSDEKGYFVGPTIFLTAWSGMKIWEDEIFAPVLSIVRADTLEEAIEVANRSELANGACLFTKDGSNVRLFRETIDAGMLGINLGVPAPMAFFPFFRLEEIVLWGSARERFGRCGFLYAQEDGNRPLVVPTSAKDLSKFPRKEWNALALVSMKAMLQQALDGGYAVGQFNLNNLEFTQAILQGAQEEKAPVILGVSEAYIPYMGGLPCIAGMVQALAEHYDITVPVALHLDHGSSYEVCLRAIHAGFTSVMIDASHHPLERNIGITERVTEAAHALGVSVEAELGRITGREDDLVVEEAEGMYAVPEECLRMARETGIDCLAPALGSVHGPYRGQPRLGFERMGQIRELTGLPLVLHGGSGLPDEEIRQAISMGTCKINVNTDNQMACTAAIRQYLNGHPEAYDPRNYLIPAREAVKASVISKIRLFGCSGKSGGSEQ